MNDSTPILTLDRPEQRESARQNFIGGSFYKSLMLNALKEMKRGSLEMRFPDGTRRLFGEGNNANVAQIRVVNPVFFRKCALFGDIGFGESYVNGDWETGSISRVIEWFILNLEDSPSISGSKRRKLGVNLLNLANKMIHGLRPNDLNGSRNNIEEHYDLSNDFFRAFLDPGMTYSCAYFESPDQNLQDAQTAKYDRLCRKLRLNPQDRVLEIGSGWGGFAVHAAKNYGCKVMTITISEEQYRYVSQRIKDEGLGARVRIEFMDYRMVRGKFDKIVSIEMLEAVGEKYLETYFETCHRLLKKDGLLGIQVITCPDSRYDLLRKNVDWIQKHIFPGSLLPSISRLNQALNRTGDLFLHHLEDMGHCYSRTLSEWSKAFNSRIPQVKSLGFDSRFIRKWNYYLSYCEAAFRMRNISVVQAIYTRPNNSTLSVVP